RIRSMEVLAGISGPARCLSGQTLRIGRRAPIQKEEENLVRDHQLRVLGLGFIALLAAMALAFAAVSSAYGADVESGQTHEVTLQATGTATATATGTATGTASPTATATQTGTATATSTPGGDDDDDTPPPSETGNGGLTSQSGMALSLGLAGLAVVGGFVVAGRLATRQR